MDLQIKFSSRRAGSFGNSPVGRVAEWMTATWLRFTCLLMTAVIVTVGFSSNLPPSDKLPLILCSPLVAVLYWYFLLFLILICRYLGRFGVVLANAAVIYFYFFSWLVVQSPPKVQLPLISRR